MKTIEIEITSDEKLVDITAEIKAYIGEKRLKKGMVQVYVPGKTSALTVAINDDYRFEKEFFKKVNHLMPKYDGMMFTGWTTSSVKAALFGVNETLIVEEGTLVLDEVQSLYFIEFQGPGKRKLFFSSQGEKLAEDESSQVPEELDKIAQIHRQKREEEARIIEEMRAEWRQQNESEKNND